jgi:putative transposase
MVNARNWKAILRTRADKFGLTEEGLNYVENVTQSPPSRIPTNSSGRNLIVDYASRKMGHTMQLESLTVEAAFAELLEHDDNCLGYWAQPAPFFIPCTGKDGIKRHTRLTFDFLAIYYDRVECYECKKECDLLRLEEKIPLRYKKTATGKWSSAEVEPYIRNLGMQLVIKSDAELKKTLLRNYTMLQEVRQSDYSSASALTNLKGCIQLNSAKTSLDYLIKLCSEKNYTKNDIYFAIKRRDLHVNLSESLLVDCKTTLVFSSQEELELHRLLNLKGESTPTRTITLSKGSRLIWKKMEYEVTRASSKGIELKTGQNISKLIPKDLFIKLIQQSEIEAIEQPRDTGNSGNIDALSTRALSINQQEKATRKLQFLKSIEAGGDRDPTKYGLKPASQRTIQRWSASARASESRFSSPYIGLVDKVRTGRPRNELPERLRELMTEVAEKLYFSSEARSMSYCWREVCKKSVIENIRPPSKGAFKRHLGKMKNIKDSTCSRNGQGAAYKLGNRNVTEKNWVTEGDFPLKVAQMDGKTFDILVVDDETGEVLGRPTITLITLPHYGAAPVGMALLFEPESSRSATVALRDMLKRFNEPPKYLIVDNGKAFNNATFDQSLGLLGTTKIDRPPRDPKFSSEIESTFKMLDTEIVHNLKGNTKALALAREMSKEVNPKNLAVWSFSELYDVIENYLFGMLWDAPSATIGTTPRKAFKRDEARSPDRSSLFIVTPEHENVAFLPEVDGGTRLIQPSRGVYIEGFYYWCDEMNQPGVAKTKVRVRYDPHDLYTVFVAIGGKWIKCSARRAPELRNITVRTRHLQSIAIRTLKNSHALRREMTHGKALAIRHEKNREIEKVLSEKRRANAQRYALDKVQQSTPSKIIQMAPRPPINSSGIKLPKLDFSHLRKIT